MLNEAFETLRDFHKNLELAYKAYPANNRLYYERRSKQYDSVDICKNKIVSFPFQTAAYVAVFLGEPQSTHRYYGELLKSYSTRMYNDDDVLEQYCISSMLVYTVDKYLKSNNLYSDFKEYRFHISFMLRCMASNNPMPKSNAHAMKKYCEILYSKISDESWIKESIGQACSVITTIINSKEVEAKDGNVISRTREFTALLIERIGLNIQDTATRSKLPELAKGTIVRCKVINWNNSFVYVELIDYKEVGSIHIRAITGEYIVDIGDVLKENQEISATLLDGNPHPVFGYSLSML